MGAAERKILIVEDDPDSARMPRVLLKRADHETRVEDDGPAAIMAARELGSEVVLLDQTREEMSGVEKAYPMWLIRKRWGD